MVHTPLARDDARRLSTEKVVALGYGLVCHAAFVAGVATMMVAMFFGMSRCVGAVPAPWNWAANAALMIQFPLAHSLLLTTRGRSVLARLAPAGTGATLSSTIFATVAGIQVFALFMFWSPTGTVWWHAAGTVGVVITALYAMSWLFLAKAMVDAGLGLQTGSLGWLALLRGRKPVYPPMPAAGLFRFTRQPIYLAFALTVWTVPTWTPDQFALALVLTAYCLAGPRLKEARFRRIYGAAFDSYSRTVPYWWPKIR